MKLLEEILKLSEEDQLFILEGLEKSLWEFRRERMRTSKCGWCKRPQIADKEEDECGCL